MTLYPFIYDGPSPYGNALPDPRTGASGQPPYPWRGRVTCDPAPEAPGSVDGSRERGGAGGELLRQRQSRRLRMEPAGV